MARRSIPSKSLLLALRGPSHLSEQWHCQNTRRTQRFLHSSTLRPAKQEILESGDKLRTPEVNHRRYRDGELVPKPLSRALGMDYPPQSGQNSGLDTRSFAQKREDFASYEKYKVRRKQLLTDVLEKNYYRDIGNLGKIHKGKSIIAPTTPFKSSLALYFPNLQGRTLNSKGEARDTTPVLRNKISIVSVLNTEWANEQVQTFTSAKENPALHELLNTYGPARGLAQFATINIEENWLKAFMIKLFWSRLKRLYPKEQHDAYFLNQQGMSDEIRDALGIWNIKVGYVYLLDGQCRIRWAGNGNARDDERQSLVNCVRRLVDEVNGVQKLRVQRQDARPVARPTDKERMPDLPVAAI